MAVMNNIIMAKICGTSLMVRGGGHQRELSYVMGMVRPMWSYV